MCFIILFFSALLVSPSQPLTSPGQNDIEAFRDLFRQGAILRSQGDFIGSTRVLEHALSFASLDRAPHYYGKCLFFLGLAKWDLGEMSEATEQFEKAGKAFAEAYDPKARDFCVMCLNVARLYELGKEDRKAGFLHRAVTRFEAACRLSRETGISDFGMKCLRQQALVYLDLKQLDLFLENSMKGLDIAKHIRNRIEQARCLNNIGVFHQWHNDHSKAIANYEDALAILEDEDDQGTEAECLNNLGLTFRELGDYDRAQLYLARALELARLLRDYQSVARGLVNIGSVSLMRGLQEHRHEDLLAASKRFQEVLAVGGEEALQPLILFAALNNLGLVQNELKCYEKARDYYHKALAMKGIEPGNPAIQQTLSNIAASYLAEKKITKALEYFQSSLGSKPYERAESSALGSYAGLGQCFELLGDEGSALSAYRRAIELIENMRERLPISEIEMIGFGRNKILPYERAIRLLVHGYSKRPSPEKLDEVFAVVEQARARAFLESLSAIHAFPPVEDILLKERLKAISKNIDRLKAALTTHGVSLATKEALRIELKIEEETSVRLIQNHKANFSAQKQSAQPPIDHISQVQPLLAEHNAKILEYFLGEEESCLITISAKSASIHVLPPRKAIEENLRPFLQSIADRAIDSKIVMGAAKSITRELVPSEDMINAEMVIIVPDRILHYLPFETLVRLDVIPDKYLMEEHAFVYCPSVSVLVALHESQLFKARTSHKLLFAVGGANYESINRWGNRANKAGLDPGLESVYEEARGLPLLPYSRREIQDIANAFPQDMVDTLVGDQATETNVKNGQLENYRIVHFACHSFLNERYPFRSALVLSRESGFDEDGYLQMREVYGLNLNADLVVLSACQTGKGIVERSEGAMDIARPFFYAGARSVLASLWPIDDEATRLLMTSFYRALISGKPVGEALGIAKREVLCSRFGHPYYWAGFILQGWPSSPGLLDQLPHRP